MNITFVLDTMQNAIKNQKFEIDPNDIKDILVKRYSGLMSEFYEMQSSFLSTRYKIHTNLESSNIIICFIKDVHLSIIRQREQYLDHDISINNFLINLKKIQIPTQKIVSIVNTTGIPTIVPAIPPMNNILYIHTYF